MNYRDPSFFVLIIVVLLFGANSCGDRDIDIISPAVAVDSLSYRVKLGESLTVTPSYTGLTSDAVISWIMDDKIVSHDTTFTFIAEKVGSFYITVEVKNGAGTAFKEFRIDVYEASPVEPGEPDPPTPPASESQQRLIFEKEIFNLSCGRTIQLLPLDTDSTLNLSFSWYIDDKLVRQGRTPDLVYTASEQGSFKVRVELLQDGVKIDQKSLTINVCPPEGTYRRPVGAASGDRFNKVYEYLPAPGQFINEGFTARTMEEACKYAQERLDAVKFVSLGAFGGYIVVGFDHSIANDGSYNIAIKGNPYSGMSEPGIVWVMQDENGDGLPNDTWYELKGSEYGAPCTISNYAVTYFRPEAAKRPVSWKDNAGNTGTVDYLAAFHSQESYYPLWVETESYTLRGTRLEARNYDKSGNGTFWVNPDYEWGYADNFSKIDRLSGDDNAGAAASANHFKISDAVTFDGKEAKLQYIDFVKVQSGLNAKSGWLGEVSTEVFDFQDYNILKKR